jgi:hypothetical protein
LISVELLRDEDFNARSVHGKVYAAKGAAADLDLSH